MGGTLRAIGLSLRTLTRSPAFTLPALLILAIGMTAATAIFTVVDAIVFRPLDLPDSDRLVIVCEDHPRLEGYCIASPGNVEDFRLGSHELSDVGIGRTWPYALSDALGADYQAYRARTPMFIPRRGDSIAQPSTGRNTA